MPLGYNPGKTIYGWEEDGKFFLSLFRRKGPPANKYDTQEEALQEAASRNMTIEWMK